MIAGDTVTDVSAQLEPRCFPSAEEMRMVRGIALLALLKAARQGEYQATFHGFRVEAVRRDGIHDTAPIVEVHLAVTLAGAVVERCALAVDAIPASLNCAESHRRESFGAETFVDNEGH